MWDQHIPDDSHLWARKGTRTYGDLQDSITATWHNQETLHHHIGSRRVTTQLAKILDTMPWHPGEAQPYASSEWQTLDIHGSIMEIFHIFKIKNSTLQGVKYVVSSSKELEYTNTGPMHLGNNEVQRICITSCMGENQIFNDYNPLQKPDIGHTLWLVGDKPICQLPLDPID